MSHAAHRSGHTMKLSTVRVSTPDAHRDRVGIVDGDDFVVATPADAVLLAERGDTGRLWVESIGTLENTGR